MDRVRGKVVIVTGAARGMGAAHAIRLVAEGASVMLTDILEEEGAALAEELGERASFIRHDVTKENEWHKVVETTEGLFGHVSVLVNNAGIVSSGPIETLEEADYRRTIDVNQVSVFLGMKAVIPSMKRAGGGSIINISSAAGIMGVPNSLSYVASKFAVRGMTKTAAIELAPFNIRANSIHPGLIRTEMVLKDSDAQLIETSAAATPAGRIGEPDEVSSIVLMLASDESRFTTGTEIIVDGGLCCQ